MNKLKKREIADFLTSAVKRASDAHSHYRTYQPDLDHKSAISEIELAIYYLLKAKEKILNEGKMAESEGCHHHKSSSRSIIDGIEHWQCMDCKKWLPERQAK